MGAYYVNRHHNVDSQHISNMIAIIRQIWNSDEKEIQVFKSFAKIIDEAKVTQSLERGYNYYASKLKEKITEMIKNATQNEIHIYTNCYEPGRIYIDELTRTNGYSWLHITDSFIINMLKEIEP